MLFILLLLAVYFYSFSIKKKAIQVNVCYETVFNKTGWWLNKTQFKLAHEEKRIYSYIYLKFPVVIGVDASKDSDDIIRSHSFYYSSTLHYFGLMQADSSHVLARRPSRGLLWEIFAQRILFVPWSFKKKFLWLV